MQSGQMSIMNVTENQKSLQMSVNSDMHSNGVTEFKDKQEIPSTQNKHAGHLPKGKKVLSGFSPLSITRHYKTIE